MNEAAWDGTPGEVVDASGHGRHGTAQNGAITTDGWLDRAGRFWGGPMHVTLGVNVFSQAELASGYTIEAWLKLSQRPDHFRIISLEGVLDLAARRIDEEHWHWYLHHNAGKTGGVDNFLWGTSIPVVGSWYHIAGTWDGAQLRLWVNGTAEGTPISETHAASLDYYSRETRFGNDAGNPGWYQFMGDMDEVRISNIARYTENFNPTRYPEAGSVTVRHIPPVQQRLTAIGWAGSFGEEYGRLTQLEVCDAEAGWVTVAEDPAGLTSPVVGLSCKVIGPDLVRATLTPRADALRSETPRLDWLEVTLEPVLQQPFRASKVRACTLAAQGIHATAVHASTVRAKRHKVTFND